MTKAQQIARLEAQRLQQQTIVANCHARIESLEDALIAFLDATHMHNTTSDVGAPVAVVAAADAARKLLGLME